MNPADPAQVRRAADQPFHSALRRGDVLALVEPFAKHDLWGVLQFADDLTDQLPRHFVYDTAERPERVLTVLDQRQDETGVVIVRGSLIAALPCGRVVSTIFGIFLLMRSLLDSRAAF